MATSIRSASTMIFPLGVSTSALTPLSAGLELGRLGAGQDRQPALGQALLQRGRDLFVLAGQDPVQQLDDRDLGADRVVKIAEFQADRSAADDQHRLAAGSGSDIASL